MDRRQHKEGDLIKVINIRGQIIAHIVKTLTTYKAYTIADHWSKSCRFTNGISSYEEAQVWVTRCLPNESNLRYRDCWGLHLNHLVGQASGFVTNPDSEPYSIVDEVDQHKPIYGIGFGTIGNLPDYAVGDIHDISLDPYKTTIPESVFSAISGKGKTISVETEEQMVIQMIKNRSHQEENREGCVIKDFGSRKKDCGSRKYILPDHEVGDVEDWRSRKRKHFIQSGNGWNLIRKDFEDNFEKHKVVKMLPQQERERSQMRGNFTTLIEVAKKSDEFQKDEGVESPIVKRAMKIHKDRQEEKIADEIVFAMEMVEAQKASTISQIRQARATEKRGKRYLDVMDKSVAHANKTGNFCPVLRLLGQAVPDANVPKSLNL